MPRPIRPTPSSLRVWLGHEPDLWTPPPKATLKLKPLSPALTLLEMQQMERNRLDTADPLMAGSLKTVLDTLDKELDTVRRRIKSHIDSDPDLKQRRDLLESIPGVGPATAAWLLTLLSPHYAFVNAKQAVAHAGLAPKLQESGKWKGTTRLSKTGDPGLRKALYMPILSAWQHNPAIRAFCERLKASGMNGKAVACAAMRKLIISPLPSSSPANHLIRILSLHDGYQDGICGGAVEASRAGSWTMRMEDIRGTKIGVSPPFRRFSPTA